VSQNIEIEFKNLLTEEEFLHLKTHFLLDSANFKKQVNHYFDTPSFSLKDHHSALRIREKGSQFEMTLKQPADQGLLETTQLLSAAQADEILSTGKLLDGEVKEDVSKMIDDADELQYFGSLTTERAEFEYKCGLLVLDHSYYLNTEDYEIEYEVTDEAEGFRIFSALLDELKIPVRTTDNKIKRFYTKKYNLLKE
jgi:uncharacterized protein YjbK